MKKKLVYIIGTRPEVIRSAHVILALKNDREIDFKLVHTGQHYDHLMNDVFFKELNLPHPDVNLKIGSGTHAEQTAKIMVKLEKFFAKFQPDIVAVFGDTNSSLAAALTAVKLQIPLAHLEAGCREWEMDIPEEINRRLIDHCSNILLAVSEVGVENLKREKVMGEIYNIGDPLYAVFQIVYKKSANLNIIEKLGLKKGEYFLLTIHRDKNVDNPDNFRNILDALSLYKDKMIVFPIHPRTRKQLDLLEYPSDKLSHVIFLDPLNYEEILHMVSNAELIITDSGGLQKEAFWSKVPCIVLREHTAWIEPVEYGVNHLARINTEEIKSAIAYIINNENKLKNIFSKARNPYHKKNTTINAINLLKEFAGKRW